MIDKLAITNKEDSEKFFNYMTNFFHEKAIFTMSLRAEGAIHLF